MTIHSDSSLIASGIPGQGYARVKKGVKKRISRHMQELGCHTMKDYLRAVNNPQTLKAVERLMSVSIGMK